MRASTGVIGAAGAVVALLVQQPSTAVASTAPNLKWLPGQADCSDGHRYTTLMVPGGGAFTPVFLTDTNKTLVPYQVRYNVVDPSGGLKARHGDLLGRTLTKPAPMPAGSVTCELTGELVVDKQVYEFTGTVTGPLR